MHICLAKALTDEDHSKIVQESESYRANGISIGILYFKLLMSKAIVDTRAMASHARENLTPLDSYTESVNSNVELFNLHDKENRQGLKARG